VGGVAEGGALWDLLTIMAEKALLLPLLLTTVRAFYVPGVAPTDYKDGDEVEVKAVKMTSAHTQHA